MVIPGGHFRAPSATFIDRRYDWPGGLRIWRGRGAGAAVPGQQVLPALRSSDPESAKKSH